MKKSLVIMFILLFVISFLAAEQNQSGNQNKNQILGASCGTVTPGTQNECCVNKGYSGWDEEKWECKEQIQNITKEKNKIKSHYNNQSECPLNCTCSGSAVKCSFENGTRIMTVYAGKSGNIIVQIKEINASINVTLYKSGEKVYGIFKNNETKEIILPDEIKEKIRNKTKARFQNESINLTEEGEYHVQARKQAKLLWMFNVNERVQFNMDAETGEITRTKNSWWGFLARDVRD